MEGPGIVIQTLQLLANATVLLGAVEVSKVLHDTPVTPLSLYAIAWLGPTTLNIFTLNRDAVLVLSGWALVWCAFVGFLVGYLSPSAVRLNRKTRAREGYASRLNAALRSQIDSEGYRKSILILFALCTGATMLNLMRVIRAFGPLGILSGGRAYEFTFAKYTPLNYLFFLNLAVIGLCAAASYYTSDAKIRHRISIVGVLSLLQTVLMGHKITFLIGMMVLVFTSSLIRLTIGRRTVVLFVAGVVGIFVLVSVLRERGDTTSAWDGLRRRIEAYVVYNYKNLENLVRVQPLSAPNSLQIGSQAREILARIGAILGGSFEGVQRNLSAGSRPSFLVNPAYNLATYLAYFYQSLSYAGLLAGPFLVGLASRLVYDRLVFRPTLFLLFANVVLCLMVAFSFSAFEFTRPQFWYILAVFYLVSRASKGSIEAKRVLSKVR